jgi:leucyl aminopeptidase
MSSVIFTDSLAQLEADVLLVCGERLQNILDDELQGAISFNLQKFPLPMTMTTNGRHSIAKLVFVENKEDLIPFIKGDTVAISMEKECVEKLAFDLLKNNPQVKKLIFLCEDPQETETRFVKYKSLLAGISLAKEIISAPANCMPPLEVVKKCQALENQGVSVQVFDCTQLKELGAHALLSVGKGSENPPFMVVMQWKGSTEPPIALVGKGICFDSGGINLKNAHLAEMKWDKAGAGAIIGTMDVVSKLKLPLNVVAVAVLAENMPDGKSLKPGDVISSLGKKNIEIVDTDCEGRLALADGIVYVQQTYSPKILIDLGTLTLETFGALGNEYAGIFCNDDGLCKQLIQAGQLAGEKLWPLPLGEYYAKKNHSKIADLKNSGGAGYGGSSVAAEFLRAFVSPNLPWAHLDIAGTAWDLDAPEAGVSAFGVSLLLEYFLNLA